MADFIDRQAVIEIIQDLYPGMPRVPFLRKDWEERYEPYIRTEKAIKDLPSAQPLTYEQGWTDGQEALRKEMWEDERDRLD